MIDLEGLKRKPQADEYIGTRISTKMKEQLLQLCDDEGIKISTVLTALIAELLKSKGYSK